ncbi:MAG: sensory rhodopsin transducer [Ginsengibacter sp.]
MAIGKKIWAIAEGYIPGYSNGPPPDFISHEAACILNTSDEDAHVQIMLYFSDKEPVGPYDVTVPARRTKHLRFNNLTDPQPVPLETDYSSVFISDQPIVLQYTRLDSRQNANALITTIAYTE